MLSFLGTPPAPASGSANAARHHRRQTNSQAPITQTEPGKDSFHLQASSPEAALHSKQKGNATRSKPQQANTDEMPEIGSGYLTDDEGSDTKQPESPDAEHVFLMDEDLANQPKRRSEPLSYPRRRGYSAAEIGAKMFKLIDQPKGSGELPSPSFRPRAKSMTAGKPINHAAEHDSDSQLDILVDSQPQHK
ncbi:MAG: hypothetical protein K0Q50_1704 [Vampirovibrio sp.]|nr:hypothetical protein [Vampirovibrio sp.]